MGDANKEVRLVRALPSNRRGSSVISNNAFSESNHAEFESLPIHFLPKGNLKSCNAIQFPKNCIHKNETNSVIAVVWILWIVRRKLLNAYGMAGMLAGGAVYKAHMPI